MCKINKFIRNAPENVVLNIFKYYHMFTFSSTLNQIPVKGTLMRMENYQNLPGSLDSPYLSWQNESNMLLYLPDISHILYNLHNCNCCKRHQSKKPSSYWKFVNQENLDQINIMNDSDDEYDYYDDYHDEYNNEYNDEYDDNDLNKNNCKCTCRQMIRMIYRYHPDSISY